MRVLRVAALGLGLAMLAGCGERKLAESDVLNVEAKLPAGMPAPVLDWRVVTTMVDRAHGTTTTLTANDAAIKFGGLRDARLYPEGAVLALTTWLQRDDPHWFGAKIPGTLMGVEMVSFARGADGKVAASYKRYAGNPMHDVTDNSVAGAREAVIVGMRAAEMP
jgi:hypothetical protein